MKRAILRRRRVAARQCRRIWSTRSPSQSRRERCNQHHKIPEPRSASSRRPRAVTGPARSRCPVRTWQRRQSVTNHPRRQHLPGRTTGSSVPRRFPRHHRPGTALLTAHGSTVRGAQAPAAGRSPPPTGHGQGPAGQRPGGTRRDRRRSATRSWGDPTTGHRQCTPHHADNPPLRRPGRAEPGAGVAGVRRALWSPNPYWSYWTGTGARRSQHRAPRISSGLPGSALGSPDQLWAPRTSTWLPGPAPGSPDQHWAPTYSVDQCTFREPTSAPPPPPGADVTKTREFLDVTAAFPWFS